jgi:cellulose synthase/poly-beta-1,6-N-acetylglucosamine synthase-like glycosyltransferase
VLLISFIFYLACLINLALSAGITLPPIQKAALDSEKYKLYLIIPVLNEEQVIISTIKSLISEIDKLPTHIQGTIVAVNDHSTDDSLFLLSQLKKQLPTSQLIILDHPTDLAQKGKGAVLNFAVSTIAKYPHEVDPRHIILGVIDADSWIDAPNLTKAVDFFINSPAHDMFQSGVAIYNTDNWLTKMQNFEFLGINSAQQQVREKYGQGIASGNGQFITLTLGLDIPWGNSLLEDLEFTLRAWIKGYRTAFNNDVVIHQSGIATLRPLIRQRIRWCQGSLQCWSYLPALWYSPNLHFFQKLDTTLWLLLPAAATIVPLANTIALGMQIYGVFTAPPHWTSSALFVIIALNLLTCLFMALQYHQNTMADNSKFGRALGLSLIFQVYLLPLIIVPYMAVFRQIRQLNQWEKTTHDVNPQGTPSAIKSVDNHRQKIK